MSSLAVFSSSLVWRGPPFCGTMGQKSIWGWGQQAMLRIGICDDAAQERLFLRAALEGILEAKSGGSLPRFLSSPPARPCWSGTGATRGEAGPGVSGPGDAPAGRHGGGPAAEAGGRRTPDRLCHRPRRPGVRRLFGVGALGYLLKPPGTREQLEAVLERARAALGRAAGSGPIVCRSGEVYYRIPLEKILYFSSDRRQVPLRDAGADRTPFTASWTRWRPRLGPGFVRVHQRYLVRAGGGGAGGERAEVYARGAAPALPVSRSCQAGGPAGPHPGGTGGLTGWMPVYVWTDQALTSGFWILVAAVDGAILYRAWGRFVEVRPHWFWRAAWFLALALTSVTRHLDRGPEPALRPAGASGGCSGCCAARGSDAGRLALYPHLFLPHHVGERHPWTPTRRSRSGGLSRDVFSPGGEARRCYGVLDLLVRKTTAGGKAPSLRPGCGSWCWFWRPCPSVPSLRRWCC